LLWLVPAYIATNTVEFTKDEEKAMNDEKKDKMMQDGVSRRSVLGMAPLLWLRLHSPD
jgi:hypothetical protein